MEVNKASTTKLTFIVKVRINKKRFFEQLSFVWIHCLEQYSAKRENRKAFEAFYFQVGVTTLKIISAKIKGNNVESGMGLRVSRERLGDERWVVRQLG